MTPLQTIYVDFNNRIKPTTSRFYRVDLDELDGLELLDRVIATDHDELSFEATIVARRDDLGYGVVELAPARILPSVSVLETDGNTQLYTESGVRKLTSA